MECLCFCVAKTINLSKVEKQLKQKKQLKWERHWNTIEIFDEAYLKYCYIFKNGTMVTWNIKRHELDVVLALAKNASEDLLASPLSDEFSYSVGNKTLIWPHPYFNVDCISLEEDDSDIKLAFSYALSQSIKLNYYENLLENLINRYNPIIEHLAKKGKFNMSRRKLSAILGDILAAKSELNLTGDILYRPKFFWQHSNLEEYYLDMEKYLDIAERAEGLNQQIDTLNEIFLMFNGYLENKHSHNLEIIIIVLLVMEIVFSVLNLHISIFNV